MAGERDVSEHLHSTILVFDRFLKVRSRHRKSSLFLQFRIFATNQTSPSKRHFASRILYTGISGRRRRRHRRLGKCRVSRFRALNSSYDPPHTMRGLRRHRRISGKRYIPFSLFDKGKGTKKQGFRLRGKLSYYYEGHPIWKTSVAS